MSKKVILLGSGINSSYLDTEINLLTFHKEQSMKQEMELIQRRLDLEEEMKKQMESQVYTFENISITHNPLLDKPKRSKKRKRARIR